MSEHLNKPNDIVNICFVLSRNKNKTNWVHICLCRAFIVKPGWKLIGRWQLCFIDGLFRECSSIGCVADSNFSSITDFVYLCLCFGSGRDRVYSSGYKTQNTFQLHNNFSQQPVTPSVPLNRNDPTDLVGPCLPNYVTLTSQPLTPHGILKTTSWFCCCCCCCCSCYLFSSYFHALLSVKFNDIPYS